MLIIRTSVRLGRNREIEISVIRGKTEGIRVVRDKARLGISNSSSKLEIMRRHPTYIGLNMSRGISGKGGSQCPGHLKVLRHVVVGNLRDGQ
jgi:hypothetical protein